MARTTPFLSCDWGTTSFRLRWVNGVDLSVIREVRNGDGVRGVHGQLSDAGSASDSAARRAAFTGVLVDGIRELGEIPSGTPVVISGMASSTVGWKELPYGRTPCGLDGTGLHVEAIDSVDAGGPTFPVWMVSGLTTGAEILRGEETELLGVMALPELHQARQGSLVVLPGTHAKHIRVAAGAVVDFRTYMTGEMLEVLSTQSLLKVSVAWPPPTLGEGPDSEDNRVALREGVTLVGECGLARALFQVRVRSVLRGVDSGRNAWFLAGLLMGAEVLDLLRWDSGLPIVLAGASHFSESYRVVLEVLGAEGRLNVVPPDRLRHATVRSHALILERLGL